MRGRSGIEVSGQLPDSDGGLGNAAAGAVVRESDLRAAACDDITGGLEDEEVGGCAPEEMSELKLTSEPQFYTLAVKLVPAMRPAMMLMFVPSEMERQAACDCVMVAESRVAVVWARMRPLSEEPVLNAA